jgi:hypothetical protein
MPSTEIYRLTDAKHAGRFCLVKVSPGRTDFFYPDGLFPSNIRGHDSAAMGEVILESSGATGLSVEKIEQCLVQGGHIESRRVIY